MDIGELHRDYLGTALARDLDGIRAFLHEDYGFVGPDGAEAKGPDAGVDMWRPFLDAFPDLSFDIRHQHVAGNVSVIELRGSGTHEGEFAGIPPTGEKVVDLPGCSVVEVADGRIVSERLYEDTYTLLRQLGVVE